MRLFFCITALIIVIMAQVAVYHLAGVWAWLFLALPLSICAAWWVGVQSMSGRFD
jgi:hypothetical protein